MKSRMVVSRNRTCSTETEFPFCNIRKFQRRANNKVNIHTATALYPDKWLAHTVLCYMIFVKLQLDMTLKYYYIKVLYNFWHLVSDYYALRQENVVNNQLIKITQEPTQTVELEVKVIVALIRMGFCVSQQTCYILPCHGESHVAGMGVGEQPIADSRQESRASDK